MTLVHSTGASLYTLTVLSSEADTTLLLVGEYAQHNTKPVCPFRLNISNPVVTFQKITSQDQHALNSLPTLTEAHFMTQVWAWQYADAKAVARQVWNALYGYIGPLPVVKAVATLTSSGDTATAKVVGHNCVAGDSVAVAGASPSDYNGAVIAVLSRVDQDHLTSAVSSGLTTPATGTIALTGTVGVSGILSDRDRDMRDPETQLFQVVQDFTVWHKT